MCMKDAACELVQVECCGVVECIKRNRMRWFGHIERIKSEEFLENVYVSEIEGPSRRGRPLGRWKDRVKEYMSERDDTGKGGLEKARRECLDRKR